VKKFIFSLIIFLIVFGMASVGNWIVHVALAILVSGIIISMWSYTYDAITDLNNEVCRIETMYREAVGRPKR
jgi:uncharacterized membrane protein YecN with MAPEG domain